MISGTSALYVGEIYCLSFSAWLQVCHSSANAWRSCFININAHVAGQIVLDNYNIANVVSHSSAVTIFWKSFYRTNNTQRIKCKFIVSVRRLCIA